MRQYTCESTVDPLSTSRSKKDVGEWFWCSLHFIITPRRDHHKLTKKSISDNNSTKDHINQIHSPISTMHLYYSFADQVNKVVAGKIIKGTIKTWDENSPVQVVKYDDGTTENFKLEVLNDHVVYHEIDGRYLYFTNRAEVCVWCHDFNDIHYDSGHVQGIEGASQEMDTMAFFAWMKKVQRFHRKWHESTTQPLLDLGVSPDKIHNATNAALNEICQKDLGHSGEKISFWAKLIVKEAGNTGEQISTWAKLIVKEVGRTFFVDP